LFKKKQMKDGERHASSAIHRNSEIAGYRAIVLAFLEIPAASSTCDCEAYYYICLNSEASLS